MPAVFLLALSVSADACAAALSAVPGRKSCGIWTGLRMACLFGGFQTGMSLLGGLAGSALSERLRLFGAVFAFGLLLFLGGTQLLSGLAGEVTAAEAGPGRLRLTALAFATSVDALAAGVSLPYLPMSPAPASLLIGAVTASLTLICALLGGRLGGRFQRTAAVAGGGVLALIGVKILLEAL